MTDSNVKKWYVVRAVSGQENKVKAYIETEITRLGMDDYISQVLVPTEKVVTVRDGKKISKDKVYFPGYVMIEANLTGEIPHIIKSITGVIGFLGEVKGGDPMPFTVGETVKVNDGPFNGFNGTVEKINEEKRKLEVMVKIFGRKTPLELSFMQVEKV